MALVKIFNLKTRAIGEATLKFTKILGYRSRRTDSKNIQSLQSQTKVFQILGFKIKFSKCLKNCLISFWLFWKNGGNFRKNEASKTNSRGRKQQKIYSENF